VAREIHERLGGASPLLANTEAQARALETELGEDYRCFVAMRYWHPMSLDTAGEVKHWAPDEIVCLPLYPQFSTTTTASSLASWRAAVRWHGLDRPTYQICCYPEENGFIETIVRSLRPALADACQHRQPTRLLLTAHGLPKRIVRAGDPYPEQVARTAAAIVSGLGIPELDWRVCYQSRVGPVEWIGPSTDDEVRRAGEDGISLIVAPISFVSEHSETLVELDLDYRRLAENSSVPSYHRIATVGAEPGFIARISGLPRPRW
jgi:ferrochelatase